MKSLVSGALAFAVTALVSGFMTGIITVAFTARAVTPADRVPRVVVTSDVAAGAPLTVEALQQHSIPEGHTTPRMLRPDDASHVLGERVQVPLRAGDLLSWTHFEQPVPQASVDACARAIHPTVEAAQTQSPEAQREVAEREAKAWQPDDADAP